MKVTLTDKKRNPDYNNLLHIPENKWSWTITGVTNNDISPHQMLVNSGGGFQKELLDFKNFIVCGDMDCVLGFVSAEVQQIGGKLHFHSVWEELSNIKCIKLRFDSYTGPNEKFISYNIEKYVPRYITNKDYLCYIVKDPVGVLYTNKLKKDIRYYRSKVNEIERKLKSKPDYFISSRFNHLKNFLSKEGSDKNTENHLRYILKKGGDTNG
jgi:CRISPR/Cas system CMR-associated protein Cmr5 small subunit